MMAVQQASLFALFAAATIFATSRWRTDPVLALIFCASALAAACGVSLGGAGKSFGSGFGAAAASPGLAVLAGTLVQALAARGGALTWLGAATRHWRARTRWAVVAMGLIAGTGASPAAALAVSSPLAQAIGRRGADQALCLGLAISVGQGLLLPSPVVIASATILQADWRLVLPVGLACALSVIAASEAVQAFFTRARAGEARVGETAFAAAPSPWSGIGFGVATLCLIVLLVVQSLGSIPSEPLGGGSARELVLGVGRPLMLLLAGCTIMLVATRLWRADGFGADGWAGAAMARAAPLILLVGAACGLQSVAQDTQMAESLAEGLSSWRLGILVPFLAAAALKALQGSSLVAAISAAGIVQPFLTGLGLESTDGRVVASLAVGAGAMAGSNVNDAFFWLACDFARLRPSQGVAWITLGTLAQGVLALLLLWLLRLSHALALMSNA
jgi:GntP family gluconate:H+ symporter